MAKYSLKNFHGTYGNCESLAQEIYTHLPLITYVLVVYCIHSSFRLTKLQKYYVGWQILQIYIFENGVKFVNQVCIICMYIVLRT